MQYICKYDKTIQEERIWESKYKIAITELEELKDKFKQMKKLDSKENQTLIAKKKQRKEATEKAKKNKTQ